MNEIQQQHHQLKLEVCLLLNWEIMDYCQLQYDCGRAYLYWYLPCDEQARNVLERSKTYWGWWRQQWAIHDESFLSHKQVIQETPIRRLAELYRELHDPRALAVEMKPNSVVLEELKKEVVYG